MEPPTCTVLVRLVRTTAVVETELARPDGEAVVLSPPVDAMATPPATAPPTRAPAMAAMATTRRAENSAMGCRDLRGASPAVGSCTAGGGSAAARHVEAPHLHDSRRFRAGSVIGSAGLLRAHLVGVLHGGTMRVDTGTLEVSVAIRRGMGVVRHPVGKWRH